MARPIVSTVCLLGVVLLTAVGAGCATSSGSFNDAGYRQQTFGYEVAYRDANARSFAGPDWQLDSHRWDTTVESWEEKTGADYVAAREQDLNQDGRITVDERRDEAIYDLKLLNRKNNGVIWAKAHPLLPENADTELEVILDNYVDSLAGNGLYAQANLVGLERVKTRNFTTFLVDKKIERIGLGDALAGTIEIAEVDRLKTDPSHRSKVVKLLLLKFRSFTLESVRQNNPDTNVDSGNKELERWPLVDCGGQQCRAQTSLLVVGYFNTPAYFADGLPELTDFLKRVSFPHAAPVALSGLRNAKTDKPAAPAGAATPSPARQAAPPAPPPPAAVINDQPPPL